jgi:hypothetical protein
VASKVFPADAPHCFGEKEPPSLLFLEYNRFRYGTGTIRIILIVVAVLSKEGLEQQQQRRGRTPVHVPTKQMIPKMFFPTTSITM